MADTVDIRACATMKALMVSLLVLLLISGVHGKPYSSEECGISGTKDLCSQGCNCGCVLEAGRCVSCSLCDFQSSCWEICRHFDDSMKYNLRYKQATPTPRPIEMSSVFHVSKNISELDKTQPVLDQTTQQNNANQVLVIVLSCLSGLIFVVIVSLLTLYVWITKCSKIKEHLLRQTEDGSQAGEPSSPVSERRSLVSGSCGDTGSDGESAVREMETSFTVPEEMQESQLPRDPSTGLRSEQGRQDVRIGTVTQQNSHVSLNLELLQQQVACIPGLATEVLATGSSDRGFDHRTVGSFLDEDSMRESEASKKRNGEHQNYKENIDQASPALSYEEPISQRQTTDHQDSYVEKEDCRIGVEVSDSSNSNLPSDIFSPAVSEEEVVSTSVKVPFGNGISPSSGNIAVHSAVPHEFNLSVDDRNPVSRVKMMDSKNGCASSGFLNPEENLPDIHHQTRDKEGSELPRDRRQWKRSEKTPSNKEIIDQLKRIDWVKGYYSEGDSIEVHVNLGSQDPHDIEQKLAEMTGADITKFRVKQKISS